MAKANARIALFVLLSILAASQLGFATGPFICDGTQFNGILEACGIATLALFALIALAYIGGETMQSPRMITWAKTEAVQGVASIIIASVLVFTLMTMCDFQIGELKSVFGLSALPKIYEANGGTDTLYVGALRYIENMAALALSSVNSLRYDLGSYEIRTSYNTFECSGDCLFSLSSVSISPFGGESMSLAITNNLLGIATMSYLAVIFQYFTLLYIYGGLFLVFLPFAIIMRSMPFMRHFGGSLIAIFVSLYLLYPLMLVADAYVAPGFTVNSDPVVMCDRDGRLCAGKDIFSAGSVIGITCSTAGTDPCYGHYEWQMEGIGRSKSAMNGLHPNETWQAIKLNVLIFMAAVFLPALNFVVIAALGRELSRFLGEEADMSRLGQMI